MDDIENGVGTSEFLLAILPYVGQLVVVILYALGMVDQETFLWLMGSGFLGGGISSKGYSDSRAKVKQAQQAYKYTGTSGKSVVEVNVDDSVG